MSFGIPVFVHDWRGRRLSTKVWLATATLIVALTRSGAPRGNCSVCRSLRSKAGPRSASRAATSWSQRDVLFLIHSERGDRVNTVHTENQTNHRQKRTTHRLRNPDSTRQDEILASPLQHHNTAPLLLFRLARTTDSLRHTISWAASFPLI